MANFQPEPLATELLIKGTCNKNKVKTFGDSILALLHQKESEQELDAIITWENKLRLTLLKIDQHLKAVKIVLSSVHSSPISNAHNQNNIKFCWPDLIIKKFNEVVTNWSSFWDQYDSVIYQNQSISVTDRFTWQIL